jgi:penicillin amidase
MPSSTLIRRLRFTAVVVAALLVLFLAAGTAWATWSVRRSFPQLDGKVSVSGLSGQVEVIRDKWGVPQVYAARDTDLFRAQGYLHAQDRFWEMDFRRHVTAGRLSELFGKGSVERDTFLRTLGWRRTAEAELALLSPATRRYLDAYADGVNAYLRRRSGFELSLEHGLLGITNSKYRPEDWSAADSVAWLKAMAWDLRSNSDDEIQRALLAERLPVDRVEQLYPAYPYNRHQPIVRQGAVVKGRYDQKAAPAPALPPKAGSELEGVAKLLSQIPPLLGPSGSGIGSNSWAVSGDKTTTGKPILANDPHLGPSMPSIWYQMGLHCTTVSRACPFDVAGVTFSGVPGVIIGHNATMAWGFTNLGADVTDLYLEKLEGDTYTYDGKQVPLTVRRETIEVAGGDPSTITVRATRHGPLLSDASEELRDVGKDAPVPHTAPLRGDGYGVALRWTALAPGRTADAVFMLDVAKDWRDFRSAARLFDVPAQNLVYADTAGNIGYQAPGLVPIRRNGDGRWPVAGWTDAYEWTRYIPFDALPTVYNPRSGYIVTANNAVTGPSYPYLLTSDWAYGYRSQRIVELLTQGGKLDVAGMQRIQMDSRHPMAPLLVPRLLRFSTDPFTRDGQKLLQGWDYTQPADSAAAAYFNVVWRQILKLTFDDELPEGQRPDGSDRWYEVMRTLLGQPDNKWWDDVRTRNHQETRDEILQVALREARLELTSRLGKRTNRWSWGKLHTLELRNASFGTEGPGLVQKLFNRGPVRLGGGSAVVDATGWDAAEGYQVDWVPSMRMVVDLGNLDSSRWINLTGESGHPCHDNYADQVSEWRDGWTIAFPFSREAVTQAREHTLTLVPRPSSAQAQ